MYVSNESVLLQVQPCRSLFILGLSSLISTWLGSCRSLSRLGKTLARTACCRRAAALALSCWFFASPCGEFTWGGRVSSVAHLYKQIIKNEEMWLGAVKDKDSLEI